MEQLKKKNAVTNIEALQEDLQDLISLLAQQADKRSTNLQVNIESLEQNIAERDKRRWRWFLVVVSSVAVAFFILGFETWERHYDRLAKISQEVVIIQQKQEAIQDKMVKRIDLQEKLIELISKDKEFEKEIEKLKQEIETLKKGKKP